MPGLTIGRHERDPAALELLGVELVEDVPVALGA